MAYDLQPKLIGAGLGIAVSGVAGGVIGSLVGTAAMLILKETNMTLDMQERWGIEGIIGALIQARQHLNKSQHYSWGNPLGNAYQESFIRALLDIGSNESHGQSSLEQFESPKITSAYDIELMQTLDNELVHEVRRFLLYIQETAVEIIVPPISTNFIAIARSLGEIKTMAEMRDHFHEAIVAPFIGQQRYLFERIRQLRIAERNKDEAIVDLEWYLRWQLLPITLRHLGEILGEESSALHVYVQLLLKENRRSQDSLKINQANLIEISAHLENELPAYIKAFADRFDEILDQRIDRPVDLEPKIRNHHREHTLIQDEESTQESMSDLLSLQLEKLTAVERELYAALSIFPANQPINTIGVCKLFHGLKGIGEAEALRFLEKMADCGLLDRPNVDGSVGIIQFRMKDTLRDLMSAHLGAEGRALTHTTMISAYRDTQEGTGWDTAPDDGYLYDHLIYHLDGAADNTKVTSLRTHYQKEMHTLFMDDEWMQKRVQADSYRFDGFLADLDRAWLRAHRDADRSEGALSYCLRYAFIHTSIIALAEAYQPAELAAAVSNGWWSVERAFYMARLNPKLMGQVKAMSAILDTEALTEEQEVQVRRERLGAAFRLPTYALVSKYDSYPQANLLEELASSLKFKWEIEEVIEAANALGGNGQFMVYDAIVRETHDNALPIVLRALTALPSSQGRSRLLHDLLPRLERGTREPVLDDLMEAVFEKIGKEGLNYHDDNRIRMYLAYLDLRRLENLLERIESLQTSEGIFAWSRLVAVVPKSRQERLARRAFLASQSLPWSALARDEALPTLAPYVAEKDLVEVLALVLEMPDEYEYVQGPILVALAPRLKRQPWLINTVRLRASAIIRTKVREAVLEALESSSTLQIETEGEFLNQEDEDARELDIQEKTQEPAVDYESLKRVSPTEPDQHDLLRLASRVGTIVRQEQGDETTSAGIDLEQWEHRKKTKQASHDLESALQYFYQGECEILYDLLPHLQTEDLDKVVGSLHRAPDPLSLLTLVPSLLPRLDPVTWAAAQEAITAVLIRLARTEIEKLANTNPEDILKDFDARIFLLSKGAGISDTHQIGVGAAAAYLDEIARQRILEAAITDGGNRRNRAELLALLIPHIDKKSVKLAMRCQETLLDSIDDETVVRCLRALSRGGFALHLDAEEREREISEALEMSITERPTIDWTPFGEYERTQIRRRYEAVCQVRLIALLAPYLHGRCLTAALDLVDATENGDFSGAYAQSTQLMLLAPMLHGDMLTRALKLGLAIFSKSARAMALEELAPNLSLDLFQQMLDEIAKIEQWNRYGETGQRATAIQAIAPFVPIPLQEQVVSLAASVTDEKHRANTLIALAPILNQENSELAVHIARSLEDASPRSMALSHLSNVKTTELWQVTAEALWSLRQQSLSSLVTYLADERLKLEYILSPAGMRSLLYDLTIWRHWRWNLNDPGED